MRVVIVSKAMLVGAYQRKAEEIARLGVNLTVLIPPSWQDRRGRQDAEFVYTHNYRLKTLPLRFNGRYHLYYFPGLGQYLRQLQPQLVHLDEEPYNMATWLGARAAVRVGAIPIFFTWQNIFKPYPPPFRWIEQANYRMAPAAIAGNQAAAQVMLAKGYAGRIRVIPQFGVDPLLFSPGQEKDPACFTIGYAGGLLPEKGVDLLIRACAGLSGPWRLQTVGSGDELPRLRQLAQELGVGEQLSFGSRLTSGEMADFYRGLDVLVLPSRTQANWKEQFGRVLIEAMACQVVVVGSDSGEIPHVIQDAGVIFPEGDVPALRSALQHLLDQPEMCTTLAAAGRQRVLDHFTMAQIAAETVELYGQLLESSKP